MYVCCFFVVVVIVVAIFTMGPVNLCIHSACIKIRCHFVIFGVPKDEHFWSWVSDNYIQESVENNIK